MTEKKEFWESSFQDKKEMWGFEPAKSAVIVKDLFLKNDIKNILIPGFGYGRNAQVFKDNAINVTGIEISKTAIEMAHKHFGNQTTIHHGPVSKMPFDKTTFDGIFCYALIHLLDESERVKLIRDCFNQLEEKGLMVFVAISKHAPTYGQGTLLSTDRYEIFEGVKMFFYDQDSIATEFGQFGLVEIKEVNENFPFFIIICQK